MSFLDIKRSVKKICPQPLWEMLSRTKFYFTFMRPYKNSVNLLKIRRGGGRIRTIA